MTDIGKGKSDRNVVFVGAGEIKFASCGNSLRSTPLGSCVAVTMYDTAKRRAGMVHVMLPGRTPLSENQQKTKYAYDAIEQAIEGFKATGSSPDELQICIAGGADVLGTSGSDIGDSNIRDIRRIFKNRGISIRAEATGGEVRREMSIVPDNGNVFITEDGSREKLLWSPDKRGLEDRITELERVKEELSISKKKLEEHGEKIRNIIDTVSVQIWTLTDERTYGIANKAHGEFVGIDNLEMAGRDIYHMFGKDVAENCRSGNREVFETGRELFTEEWVAGKDGNRRLLSIHKTPKFNIEGKIEYVVCTAEDITQKKSDSIDLKKLTQAVEQSPSSIVITDLEGNIEYVNPKFTELTGYSKEEALGKNPRILKAEEGSIEKYRELWETILSGGIWKGEFLNKKKNGELYMESAVISPVKDGEGKIVNFMGIKKDITEQKEAERSRDINREILDSTINSMGISASLVDKNLKCIFMNDSFRKWASSFDIDVSSPEGKNLKDIFPFLSEKAIKEYDLVWQTGKPIATTEKTFLAGGTEIMTRTRKIPIKHDGKMQGVLTIVEDITDDPERHGKEMQKKLHEILERAPFGVVIIGLDRTIKWANRQACHMAGVKDIRELEGKHCGEYLCPADQNECPILDKGQEVDNSERILRRRDGKEIPILKTVVVTDFMGEQVLLETFVDISAVKGAQENVERSEKKYRLFFESSREAIMNLAPPDWKFIEGNKAAVEMFEAVDANRFVTLGAWDISPEKQPDGTLSREKAPAMIEKAMKEGHNVFNWDHKTLSGKVFPTVVMLTRMEIDDKVFLQAIVHDMTQQKKLENSLNEEKKKLSIKVKEIEQLNEIMKTREIRVVELKNEINALLRSKGGAEKYTDWETQ